MKRWVLALSLILAVPAARAEEPWASVPPEVWSIKDGQGVGAQGAVILDAYSRYGNAETEHRIRILILSEAGKAAAQLTAFPQELKQVEGRTVYPDGRVLVFSKKQDFSEQTLRIGSEESKQQVVIPPGLTSHCIVDVHWTISGSYLWMRRFERDVLGSYPIQRLVLELSQAVPLSMELMMPKGFQAEKQAHKGYWIYTFKDLPATGASPYSVKSLRALPSIVCFHQPGFLRDLLLGNSVPSDAYWSAATKTLWKPEFAELETGSKYRVLSTEILAGLPEDRLKAATEILNRLNARVLNVSWLTAAEKAARSKDDDKAEITPRDLNESARRGWTNGGGAFYLAYQLFKDAGLHPKILFVADRNRWVFRYDMKEFYQFDDFLIGIESADGKKAVFLDPANRFLPLGVVMPRYQGMPGLELDPDTWTVKPSMLHSAGPEDNRTNYTYDLTLDDASVRFRMGAVFGGYPEYLQRWDYYALDAAAASKQLKEAMAADLPGYAMSKATVRNASTWGKPVALEAEGVKDGEEARRVQVSPFPGMPRPLWVPSEWPSIPRVDTVVMPYCFTWTADTTIHVPEGWTASLPEPLSATTPFGTVTWIARPAEGSGGRDIQVHYEVVVTAMFGTTSSINGLKSFLAAMDEGWKRRVTLDRRQH